MKLNSSESEIVQSWHVKNIYILRRAQEKILIIFIDDKGVGTVRCYKGLILKDEINNNETVRFLLAQ